MARILILTPQLPYPPEQGTSLRNFHIIRGLAERHQIDLLTFSDLSQALEMANSPLQDLCSSVEMVPLPRRSRLKRIRQTIGNGRPDLALRLHSQPYLEALTRCLSRNDADIVQVEGLELAYAMPTIRSISPQSRIVFDAHNAETELQRRALRIDLGSPQRWHAAAYSWLQVGRLRQMELWACESADWVTAVSEPDKRQLLALAPGSNYSISVIPNPIDVGRYREIADGVPGTRKVTSAGDEPASAWDLVFIGKMDYRPNVDAVLWFASAIWPLVRAGRPKATWAVVGKEPHARLNRLKKMDGVTLTGPVESVLPYLAGARVCIMPFRMGSGTRLKLIEAMAAGKAIVTTSLGAEGFPVTDGRQLLVVDDAQDIAQAILKLLDDPQQRERLGHEARILARQYDWRQVIPKFDEVYHRLLLSEQAEG